MITIMNIAGKKIAEAETFQGACIKGIEMLNGEEFRIKEGSRKSEVIDKAFIDWMWWVGSPERKVIEVPGGFKLV